MTDITKEELRKGLEELRECGIGWAEETGSQKFEDMVKRTTAGLLALLDAQAEPEKPAPPTPGEEEK